MLFFVERCFRFVFFIKSFIYFFIVINILSNTVFTHLKLQISPWPNGVFVRVARFKTRTFHAMNCISFRCFERTAKASAERLIKKPYGALGASEAMDWTRRRKTLNVSYSKCERCTAPVGRSKISAEIYRAF